MNKIKIFEAPIGKMLQEHENEINEWMKSHTDKVFIINHTQFYHPETGGIITTISYKERK